MQLLMLFILVVGTYGGLTLLNGWVTAVDLSREQRGRMSLAIFFIFTGVGHFIMPQEMAQMLPDFVPLRTEIIYITGILEIAGAVGLLFAKTHHLAAISLILFLIAVLPANIYAAFHEVDFGGHAQGPIYLLVRVPFQLFLITWAYYFGLKRSTPPRLQTV